MPVANEPPAAERAARVDHGHTTQTGPATGLPDVPLTAPTTAHAHPGTPGTAARGTPGTENRPRRCTTCPSRRGPAHVRHRPRELHRGRHPDSLPQLAGPP